MPKNPTPIQDTQLKKSFSALIKGCQRLETSIGIKQNTAQVLQQSVDDIDNSQKSLNEEKKVLAQLRKKFDSADRDGKKTISNCRLRLAKLFGQEFNPNWEKAGFPDQSTAVPESLDKRQGLLLSLERYFQAYTEQESLDMDATAAHCREAGNQVTATRTEVEAQVKVRSKAVKVRNHARIMLRKRYRSLIVELGLLLSSDDVRWKEFGLNPPTRNRRTKAEMEQALRGAVGNVDEDEASEETDGLDDSTSDTEEDTGIPHETEEVVTVPEVVVESQPVPELESHQEETEVAPVITETAPIATEPAPTALETAESPPPTGNRRRTTSTRNQPPSPDNTESTEAPPTTPGQLEFMLSPDSQA